MSKKLSNKKKNRLKAYFDRLTKVAEKQMKEAKYKRDNNIQSIEKGQKELVLNSYKKQRKRSRRKK